MVCGIDIIEISRIENSIKKYGYRFLNRIFTNSEILYCENKKISKYKHYAARFSAKEAVVKALGKGMIDGICWKDIEVNKQNEGKPTVKLQGKALDLYKQLSIKSLEISMSHSNDYAIATVIAE